MGLGRNNISMKHPKDHDHQIFYPKTVAVGDWALSIHGWMELVIMEDNPFSIVENEVFRNFHDDVMDILARAESSKTARLQKTQSTYHPVNHILPTSNIVARLFSRAKLVKTDHRKTMTAAHLDAVLFLRYNKSLWNAETIHGLLDEKNSSVVELEGVEEVRKMSKSLVISQNNCEGNYCNCSLTRRLIDH
jgi:hypothetical protein